MVHVIHCLLSSSKGERGAAVLLDAVRLPDGRAMLSFDREVDVASLDLPESVRSVDARHIGGAGQIFCRAFPEEGDISLAGTKIRAHVAAHQQSLLAGTNALLGVRNGEPVVTVREWLRFHVERHGATAAVIVDRARPGTDLEFQTGISEAVSDLAGLTALALVRCDHPLGKPGHPSEAHPLSVPEAPGKDRMEATTPDPWSAPLGASAIFEILRHRFLDQARAVAHLDVHDLLEVDDGPTAFDLAVASPGGLIQLLGRHVFPWRIRPGQTPHFGDHICTQFDAPAARRRWCIAPERAPREAIWRMVRIGNASPDRGRMARFYRHMALRHPTEQVSQIVPKTSLVEHAPLIAQASTIWRHRPVRLPAVSAQPVAKKNGRRAIVTCMKNEGPFILEWLAYHRAIGFDDVLVYSNDCTDGTDSLLDLLQSKGLLEHRGNPFREVGMKPQHAALHAAQKEPVIRDAEWIAVIDVDEFMNIKVGEGTLDALFAVVPQANMIAMTWRLFGNSDRHDYEDSFLIDQFTRCAPEMCRKPHQAWGFKTLFQNIGLFKKLGVHRPKGLNPQLWERVAWVNGSGRPLPRQMYRNAWRSTLATYGYDLVQLNHYAVRSAESFLVKRDRGRVNHVDRDQGLAYWFRMNNNAEEETSIQRRRGVLAAEHARLMADPEIAEAHMRAVSSHKDKIADLKSNAAQGRFFEELTSARMEKLSRMHAHFGSNVFLAGPEAIPEEVVRKDPGGDFYFTVPRSETAH
ncbi:MAG: glycosyltransferase family 2 protein [Pseudomonadota bacterium]